MKKKLVALSIAIFSIFSAKAQTPTPAPANNPNAPVITFEKTDHDYGKINKGGNGDCEFKFTNKGKEPLRVIKAQASCGCTTPKVTTDPVLPGKSGVVKVHFDTNRVGVFNKTITVTSNASNSSVQLSIKGDVLDTPPSSAPVKPNEGATPKAQ